jgi:glycosyltransferase involved in cell wall biosynthesis
MTSAVIPAFNEEQYIESTVRALASSGLADEIIVVDDGSTDHTYRVAASAGAKALHLRHRRGKRGAQDAGVRAARGNVLLFLDADLGETAANAGPLLNPVLDGECDMAIGILPSQPGKGGGFGLVVGLARYGIFRVTGRTMEAPLSGQRALRRAVWARARGVAHGFGAEVALTIDAICAGYHVIEVPVDMSHRVTGNDLEGFRHRARQFVDVARALWVRRKWRCHQPVRRSESSS